MREETTDNSSSSTAAPLTSGLPVRSSKNCALDAVARVPAPVLRFNWSDWLPFIEDETATDQQKRDMIETLWSIVIAFVDFGWSVEANPESGEALDLCAILSAVDSAKEEQ